MTSNIFVNRSSSTWVVSPYIGIRHFWLDEIFTMANVVIVLLTYKSSCGLRKKKKKKHTTFCKHQPWPGRIYLNISCSLQRTSSMATRTPKGHVCGHISSGWAIHNLKTAKPLEARRASLPYTAALKIPLVFSTYTPKNTHTHAHIIKFKSAVTFH